MVHFMVGGSKLEVATFRVDTPTTSRDVAGKKSTHTGEGRVDSSKRQMLECGMVEEALDDTIFSHGREVSLTKINREKRDSIPE